MRDRLFSLRAFESGEKYIISMLLVQSLCLGMFIGAYDITAHSLFLEVFNEKILAYGYISAGFSGLIILAAYFFLKPRMKASGFILLNLAVIGIIAAILRIALDVNPSNNVRFIIFAFIGPLNAIALLGPGNAASGIIAVTGRRILNILDAYLAIGILLIGFSIPLLSGLGVTLNTILIISIICVFLALLLQIFINKRLPVKGTGDEERPEPGTVSTDSFRMIRDSRFAKLMLLFTLLSVVSSFFIQYAFLAETRVAYPSAARMAGFFGIFTGVLIVLTLIIRHLAFSWILKRYGLKVCLVASPVILIVLTLIAAVTGSVTGATGTTTAGFLVFFIILILLRLSSGVMEASLENTSFKLFYQPVDDKLRSGIQSVIGDAGRSAGILLAGLVLAGLGLTGLIRLHYFIWFLILILLIWFYIALRLWTSYCDTLSRSLATSGSEDKKIKLFTKTLPFLNRYYGERLFRLNYFNLISGDFSVFESTRNRYYFRKLIDYAIQKKDINLVPAVRKMTASTFDDEFRRSAVEFVKNMEQLQSGLRKEDERLNFARKVLSETRMPQTSEILRLLRDKSVESKRLAIYLIGKFKLSDLLQEVCECLNIPGLENDTAVVLSSFGSAAEEDLIRFYLVSSANISTSKTLLRLLSRISLNDGGFLFSRLWSNSRQLKEVALQCLVESGFKPGREEKDRLNMLISDVAGIMTWSLAARRGLEKNHDNLLMEELNKEFSRWGNFLIDLLSVTYDSAAVNQIRCNLEMKTVESVHHAQAILDFITDDTIKTKLIFLLDVLPDDEKLKNLVKFFPVEIPEYGKLLEEILNRDYNLLSVWTKACVLRYMEKIRDTEMSESVVALLFSPEQILQEEAVRLLARSDRSFSKAVYSRIPVTIRKNLDKIIEGETDERENLFNKVIFLSEIIGEVTEEELLVLARRMMFQKDLKEASSSLPDGYVIWHYEDDNTSTRVNVLYTSALTDLLEKIGIIEQTPVYILSFKAIDEFLFQYPDRTKTIMSLMEKFNGGTD